MSTAFEYKIEKHIATLSERGNTSKELNLVSYNGAAAKYDLRSWMHGSDGNKLLKGITLTEEEAAELKAALNSIKSL